MDKLKKAKEKLKTMALFCEEYECFEVMFFESLDKSRLEEALRLVLGVCFLDLKSEGELFNELMEAVDSKTQERLRVWLKDSYKEKVKR